MTCVVGFVDNGGKVWMGADSCVSNGDSIRTSVESKIITKDTLLLGVSGLIAGTVCLEQELKASRHDMLSSKSDFQYIYWISKQVKKALVKNNLLSKDEDNIDLACNEILIGYNHKLYKLDGTLTPGEVYDNYMAIGDGAKYALGNMYGKAKEDGKEVIREALECSAKFASSVRAPFRLFSLLGHFCEEKMIEEEE